MLLYCDASCLVKLYVDEEQSPAARSWVAGSTHLVTSEVAQVEVCAAFARRQRQDPAATAALDAALERFREDWASFHRMVLDAEAGAIAAQHHPLRALDAIHLAAALRLREAAPGLRVVFASFDKRQCAAARAEGLLIAGDGDGAGA